MQNLPAGYNGFFFRHICPEPDDKFFVDWVNKIIANMTRCISFGYNFATFSAYTSTYRYATLLSTFSGPPLSKLYVRSVSNGTATYSDYECVGSGASLRSDMSGCSSFVNWIDKPLPNEADTVVFKFGTSPAGESPTTRTDVLTAIHWGR